MLLGHCEESDMPDINVVQVPFETLVRSVAEGLRDVYRSQQWDEVSPRAEALWSTYAATTGLGWADVAERVRRAWGSLTA
jgi:hypothetical protein